MRRILPIYVILLTIVFLCVPVYAEETDISEEIRDTVEKMEWNVSWEGITYIGSYSGETLGGKPDGKGDFEGSSSVVENTIEYSGDWQEGEFEGTGKLTDKDEHVTYDGSFKKGKRNGKHKLVFSETEIYEVIYYVNDIPYGIYRQKEKDGTIIDKDRFLYGYRLSELRKKELSSYVYEELLYNEREQSEQFLEISGTVKKTEVVSQSNELWMNALIEDQNGDKFIIKYTLSVEYDPQNYMPVIKKGEHYDFYGYYKESGNILMDGKVEGTYPILSAIGVDWKEYQELDLNNLEMSYVNFQKYVQEYKNQKVKLSGKIVRMDLVNLASEDKYKVYISSKSYSTDEELYCCIIKKELLQKKGIVLKENDEITLNGLLRLEEIVLEKKNSYTRYPIVVAKTIG